MLVIVVGLSQGLCRDTTGQYVTAERSSGCNSSCVTQRNLEQFILMPYLFMVQPTHLLGTADWQREAKWHYVEVMDCRM